MADYTLEGVKWEVPSQTVTWSIATANYADRSFQFASFLPSSFESDLQEAFARWSSVANIHFQEVADSDAADIRFGFEPIDGQYGIVGETQYKVSSTSSGFSPLVSADIAFDSDESWSDGGNGHEIAAGNFALYPFALHEIGHALGLAHYTDAPAIMNPTVSVTDLQTSDIDGIQAIYGAPGSPSAPSAFYVDGSQGVQTLVGAGYPNFISTAGAYGNGTVTVDLRGGTVSKGGTTDATLSNIQGVQLGNDPSVVIGLTSGVDLLYGGGGADQFFNEGATDYIRGGTGTNSVIGGSGTTVFYGNGGTDAMRGGTGANFMQAGGTAGSNDTFYGGGGQDFVYGGAGRTVLAGGSGTEDLTGGSGTTVMIGSNQSSSALNIMNGGTGTDTFYGGVGTNLFFEGPGTDTFAGGAGTDYIYGGAGRSFVYGGSGTDVVTTGTGNQYLKAGTGITVFNDAASNLTAGRFDRIDNFSGSRATDIYMPSSVQGQTSFVDTNGGTAILTTIGGGNAELFASNTSVATVQAHTHFTL